MRKVLSFLLYVSLVFLFACGDDEPTAPAGTNLSGKVLVKATGETISGAKVSFGNEETTSDASGNYLLSNVPKFKQALKAEESNYAVYIEEYTAVSGENVHDIELETHTEYCTRVTSVEYQGRTYNTVLVVTQCWFKENLNVGTQINYDVIQTNNAVIEKYCENNRLENCNEFGGLYQWDEAMNHVPFFSKQGICPDGWYVPEFTEYETLGAFVNEDANALKAEGAGDPINDPKGVGTNTSGWTGLMGGTISYSKGDVYTSGPGYGGYWSSTKYGDNEALVFGLLASVSNILYGEEDKREGLSIRCLKD